MPKQSSTQKKIMHSVMHEYKEGDLKSGSGDKVKSREQAVAIGLKESGASKYASKAENERNLAKTKQKKRIGKTGVSKSTRKITGKSKTSASEKKAKGSIRKTSRKA